MISHLLAKINTKFKSDSMCETNANKNETNESKIIPILCGSRINYVAIQLKLNERLGEKDTRERSLQCNLRQHCNTSPPMMVIMKPCLEPR